VATLYGYLDSVLFNPTAGGTTDWTVSSAVTGFLTPASAGAINGTVYRYRAQSIDLTQWEFGEGAYNTTGPVLARTTIRQSSNSNLKVTFTAAPQIALVASMEDGLDSFFSVNTITGTTYSTNVISDLDSLLIFTTAASCAVTLTTTACATGWNSTFLNSLATGKITFTPQTGTIDGAASMTLDPKCTVGINFDGTNFQSVTPSDGGTF
jgi:hypothetical protein